MTIKEPNLHSIVKNINDELLQINILTKGKTDEEVCARSCLANVLYREYDISKSCIGRVLKRDHSTVIHMINNHELYSRIFNPYNKMYRNFNKAIEMNINKEMSETQKSIETADKAMMYDKMIVVIRNGKETKNLSVMINKLNELEEEASNYGI